MPTPGEILNIGPNSGQMHFSVQVAEEGASVIDTYTQDDIAAGLDLDPYFTDNTAGDAVQMMAPADGPTTTGSTFARCELRELDQAGNNITFDPYDGDEHILAGEIKITHHPTNAVNGIGIVLAQLHNGNRDRLAFRTQMVTPANTLRLRYRENGAAVWQGTNTTSGNVEIVTAGAANIVNVWFRYKIHIHSGNGLSGTSGRCTADFYINDVLWRSNTSFFDTANDNDPAGWYFKTGTYNQFTAAQVGTSEYGQVELRNLYQWHTGWPEPGATTPTAELTDDFNDNSIDPAKWPNAYGAGFSETGGKATVAAGPAYAGFGSATGYSLNDSYIAARVTVPAPTAGATFCQGRLQFYVDADHSAEITVDTVAQDVQAFLTDGAGNTLLAVGFDYDPVDHAWIRLREAAGTMYWEASATGITWTTLTTHATPTAIATTTIGSVYLEAYDNGASPGIVTFDNLNITPASVPVPTGQFFPMLAGL